MTTITIKENIKLLNNSFDTYDNLVNFIIYNHIDLQIEELNQNEKKFINWLKSYKNFKNVANLVWI